jgi:hypothetical protein
MKRLFWIVSVLMGCLQASAQDLWDKKVDDAQALLCKKDSSGHCYINVSNNADLNLLVTSQLVTRVDDLQKKLAADKAVKPNDRIRYLRILQTYVSDFNSYARSSQYRRDFSASVAQEMVSAFEKQMAADRDKTSLREVVKPLSLLPARSVVYNEFARAYPGYNEAVQEYVLKDCAAHPKDMLNILARYPGMPFVDSMIVVAAYYDQNRLYDFAQNKKGPLYNRLKNHPHPLVKTLFTMAGMETGRSLTPFLDAISKGQVTMDSINKIQNNIHAYYRLLTETRIKYFDRVLKGDTPLAYRNFNEKFAEKALYIVKEINEAHTQPDARRFAILNPLNSKELYYMAVLGIDELFTSSFVRGVYQQMADKLGKQSSDQLLFGLKFDYFRKFIKISAGYNKLSHFLKLMPDSNALYLMNAFISNVDNAPAIEDIEDAVDVADAYVGIGTNPELKTISELILKRVKEFRQKRSQEGSMKGETVYRLFDQIFNAYRDTANAVNLSAQLGLPPITRVDYKLLAPDTAGTVVKLYFYGDEDKDGQISFDNFMRVAVGDKTQWKVDIANAHFVSIKSLKGKPITIFANRPLYDHTKQSDPDDTAKLKMSQYMEMKKLKANFVMHRGHSYHVPTTLKFMEEYDTSARMIVLGSCGGYQNLDKVLSICPEAHIVSSKQTGTFTVNDPMLNVMFGDIGKGKDILWPEIWPRIKTKVGGGKPGEMFVEYIPPHQNLGMIFIKAYKKQMGL